MSLTGKTMVITGATAGVGEATAERFARAGARIVITARDRAKGEALLVRLRTLCPEQEHRAVYGDLSLLADMRRVAAELANSLDRVDRLVNNAGAWFDTRQETADGLELTFALNHMSYFVITNALLPAINATPDARVLNTASRAYRSGPLDFDDLQTRQDFSMGRAYGRSKLCNVLFTRSLARRLAPGRTTTCYHPGTVATGMWSMNEQARGIAPGVRASIGMLTPEESAEVLEWHATSTEAAEHSGAYFELTELQEVEDFARDDEAAERLWEVSEALVASC